MLYTLPYILPGLEKVHSNVGLFAKCEASLRRYENIINFHNKHRIRAELRFLLINRSTKCLKESSTLSVN